MGLFIVNLSDVGEGVAEAELIEWHVAVGDTVAEDQLLGVVMTDKAAVDLPSSVMGKVVKLCAEVGELVAVGSELVHIEVDGITDSTETSSSIVQADTPANAATRAAVDGPRARPEADAQSRPVEPDNVATDNVESDNVEPVDNEPANKVDTPETTDRRGNSATTNTKVLAAPSVRQYARDLGIELSSVTGTGPGGRVVHADLEQLTERRANPALGGRRLDDGVKIVKVVGMRRAIAEKMALANKRIPHITIVEEVDMQYLEELRDELNKKHANTKGKLTLLPFVMKSIIEAVREQPMLNALYDDEAGTVAQHNGVHIGIATQTPNGLMVPVVKHSEANSLWENAAEVSRLAQASKDAQVKRDELGGSTITISSLGPLGALATTPIINHPEVTIVGINKMQIRPVWDGQQFVPKKMMNLSCSFDHRVIDGWDAAVFVQKLKSLLEKPAMLFMEA